LFGLLTNYSPQHQTSLSDTPPKSGPVDNVPSLPPHENVVASSDVSAAMSTTVTLPALLMSPSPSQKQSLSLNLFINKGIYCTRQIICEYVHPLLIFKHVVVVVVV